MSKANSLKFLLKGAPFFVIVAGGAVALTYFQQVRYDFRKIKQFDSNLRGLKEDLAASGINIRKDRNLNELLKEVEELDTEHWENIRGPRESEDNTEFRLLREKRQKDRLRQRETRKLEGGAVSSAA